jgi:cytochrome P450
MLDPFSVESHADPHPLYARLRAERPVAHDAERDLFTVARFADVQLVERDWETFSHASGVDLDDFGDAIGDGDFLDMDPPRHDDLRALVRRFFTPKAVARLEDEVRARARALLREARECRHVDVAEAFAWRLPVGVISQLLGVPAEDEDALLRLIHDAERREPNAVALSASARSAVGALRIYFAELCGERRSSPRDDVVSAIANESASAGSPDALPGMCFLLFVAGVSTTASLIGNAIATLEGRHDEWRALTGEAAAAAAAVEELLRYDAPIQYFKKTATVDTTLHDVTIPAGSSVVVLYGSANRDERVYAQPDRLDFRREFRKHKAFGDGIHFCLGAHLARLEARVALSEFFAAAQDYALRGPAERISLHNFRGFTHLGAEIDWATPEW